MSNKFDWSKLRIPTLPIDDDYLDYVNPADAFKKQADAINMAAPLWEELEEVNIRLDKYTRLERELVRRILADNMSAMKGTQTRTSDLVDAFVLEAAKTFKTEEGEKNVTRLLLRLRRNIEKMQSRKDLLERRLRAVEKVAEFCDRIMNWVKHEARLEMGRKL